MGNRSSTSNEEYRIALQQEYMDLHKHLRKTEKHLQEIENSLKYLMYAIDKVNSNVDNISRKTKTRGRERVKTFRLDKFPEASERCNYSQVEDIYSEPIDAILQKEDIQ